MLQDWNAKITRVLLGFGAAIIFMLGFIVCADVFGRALFNAPLKGAPEIVSMSIVIICFLLAGYAVQSGSMIYTDVFSGMFGTRGRATAQLLSSILGIFFFGLVVWGSFEPTLHAWTSGEYEGEGALRVPVWPARIVVLIGAVLVVTSYIVNAMNAISTIITGRESDAAPVASTHL